MKHIIGKHRTLNRGLLLFAFLGVILSGCSSPNGPKDKSKGKEFCTATITHNGKEISFSADNITVISAPLGITGIGFLDTKKSLYIYLAIQDFKGIKVGDYSMAENAASSGAYSYLTLDQEGGTDLFSEQFRTNPISSVPHGTGMATITSVSKNKIEGTFSATVYSGSSDAAKITDGKFKVVDKDFEF